MPPPPTHYYTFPDGVIAKDGDTLSITASDDTGRSVSAEFTVAGTWSEDWAAMMKSLTSSFMPSFSPIAPESKPAPVSLDELGILEPFGYVVSVNAETWDTPGRDAVRIEFRPKPSNGFKAEGATEFAIRADLFIQVMLACEMLKQNSFEHVKPAEIELTGKYVDSYESDEPRFMLDGENRAYLFVRKLQ